jgi:hypothetical protein
MATGHPSWCIGTEATSADHVSETLHAAASDDSIDIRLRLTHPEDAATSDLQWTVLELELVEGGEVFGFPLDLRQAKALVDSLARLLPSPSERKTNGVDAWCAADPDEPGSAHSELGA